MPQLLNYDAKVLGCGCTKQYAVYMPAEQCNVGYRTTNRADRPVFSYHSVYLTNDAPVDCLNSLLCQ
jgi:hypothetical protein